MFKNLIYLCALRHEWKEKTTIGFSGLMLPNAQATTHLSTFRLIRVPFHPKTASCPRPLALFVSSFSEKKIYKYALVLGSWVATTKGNLFLVVCLMCIFHVVSSVPCLPCSLPKQKIYLWLIIIFLAIITLFGVSEQEYFYVALQLRFSECSTHNACQLLNNNPYLLYFLTGPFKWKDWKPLRYLLWLSFVLKHSNWHLFNTL